MSLFVGTSGWAYREWKRGFYPPDLAYNRFLQHYSSVLSACEVNATFYRLHSKPTFAKWASSVPGSFRFAIKAHRRLTHQRRIAFDKPGPSRFLERFLSSLAPLGAGLGCVLFQFPPTFERDDAALEGLIEKLPPGFRFACEFRHSSWAVEAVGVGLAERGGTVCLSETEGFVPTLLAPGPIAYVRLRAERYGEDARQAWLDLVRREAAERDVYVFAKHEGIPAGDPFAGVGLAQWLAENRALGVPGRNDSGFSLDGKTGSAEGSNRSSNR